jgi:hypothetical protein
LFRARARLLERDYTRLAVALAWQREENRFPQTA